MLFPTFFVRKCEDSAILLCNVTGATEAIQLVGTEREKGLLEQLMERSNPSGPEGDAGRLAAIDSFLDMIMEAPILPLFYPRFTPIRPPFYPYSTPILRLFYSSLPPFDHRVSTHVTPVFPRVTPI